VSLSPKRSKYTAAVKRTLTLALAVAAVGLQAQAPLRRNKLPKLPPVNFGPAWKPSKLSPASLAKSADAKVAALRNVSGTFNIQYTIGPNFGGAFGDIKVRDNKTFLLQYEDMHYSKSRQDEPTHKLDVRANGSMASISGKDVLKTKIPLSIFHIDESKQPRDWVLGVQRYTLGGMHREPAISHLVAMASKRGSGFTVQSGERKFPYKGKSIPQQHIVVERTKAEAAKLGPVRIEITIDVARGLPVSARIDAKEKNHPAITTVWFMNWHLRPAKFSDEDFAPPGRSR